MKDFSRFISILNFAFFGFFIFYLALVLVFKMLNIETLLVLSYLQFNYFSCLVVDVVSLCFSAKTRQKPFLFANIGILVSYNLIFIFLIVFWGIL